MDDIIAAKTRRNYEVAWQGYRDWCAAEGLDPLTGDGSQVAAWLLAAYADGRKPGTLKLWRVAVSYAYNTDPALLGRPNPANSDDVRNALKRITRAAARAGRTTTSATAMTRDVLEQVLTVSALRRRCESEAQAHRRHVEMSAVLPLMFDSMLRADEMVRARWGDLSTTPHPTSGHYKLRIPVSKTDQNGNGTYSFVSRPTWEALQRWRTMSPDPDGRICTSPSANALAGRIRRLGEAAGIEGLSGHSCRRGAATELAHNGATEQQLKSAGRWKRSDTVARYIDEGDAANGGMAILYGNGSTDPAPAPAHQPDPLADLTGLAGALGMAVALGADRDHPAVVECRAAILDLWPLPDPPRDCATPGCAGMLLRITGPNDRYCGDPCSTAAANALRNARRRQRRASS